MFTLPKPRRAQPWNEQLSVRKWLSQIFGINSRKRDYHVTVGRSEAYAWVHPEGRRVYVTNELPPVAQEHVRFDPVDTHRRTEMMLKGFMAHEAAHVRFSGPKPSGKLGYIWNALEDERIERLIAQEFPELKAIFTFLGDVATAADSAKPSYTAMEGVLTWRFEHDRLVPRWRPRKEDAEIWAREIRPRVELAWQANDSREVEQLASEIQTLLREHQQSLTPPQQPAPPAAPPTPEHAGNQPDASEPGEEGPPEEGQPDDSEPGEGEEAGQDEADEGKNQEQDGASSGDGDGQPEPGEDEGAGEQEGQDDAEQGDGPGDAGEGTGQDDAEQSDSPGDAGEGTGQDDTGEGEGQEDGQPDGAESDQGADEGEGQPGDAETGQGDGAGEGTASGNAAESSDGSAGGQPSGDPSSSEQSGPQSEVSPEQQAAENGDDEHVPETWKQISATGADADERDGDAQKRRDEAQAKEDGRPQPEQAQDVDPQTPGQAQPESRATSKGRGVGTEDTGLPGMPEPDTGGGSGIAEGVEGHARKLAPLLKPPERPGRTRPHRSKGRYDARRDARDAERVFMRKSVPSRPKPIRVRLLIDVSGSMNGAPITCARAAASMVIRAAALSGGSAEVHLFNTHHQPVITTPMPYADAQALVAGITVSGSTRLAPALAALTHTPPNPLESELIVVVCDGQLTAGDYAECAVIVRRGQALGKRYLPVLISEAAAYHGHWREIFGSALPCESVTDLAVNLKAALTSLRAHLGG